MQTIKTLFRIARYTFVRVITLFLTVIVGTYLIILIANAGGYVDEFFRAEITQSLMGQVMGGWLDDEPQEERERIIADTQWQMEEAMGLHQPFLLRSARWLVNGLTLNLGEIRLMYFFTGGIAEPERSIQEQVLERLPYTLLLVATSNVLIFIASVAVALFLSRSYAGLLDRIMVVFASLTSAPSWIFGIILIVLLAAQLHFLPFPKKIDIQYAELSPHFIRLVLSQMIMPVMAIFLSVFFLSTYTWRTFFLLYSGEDYVEMAKAKGLSSRVLERRYILRPSLPYVITSFALMVVVVWQGAVALEILFYWPGIGPLFLQGISRFNTPLIVAVVVIFAYLLAITVFFLDIIYALVDPRIRVGNNAPTLKPARVKRSGFRFPWVKRERLDRSPLQISIREFNSSQPKTRLALSQRIMNFWRRIGSSFSSLKSLIRYPTAVIGLVIILTLVGISIYTIFTIPYQDAIDLWRAHSGEEGRSAWYRNPKYALPVWVNIFRRDKLPETVILGTEDGSAPQIREQVSDDLILLSSSHQFDYTANAFPDDLTLYFNAEFGEKRPLVALLWLTPDGREIDLASFSINQLDTYYLSQDPSLERKLSGSNYMQGLFGDPATNFTTPLQGTYELRIDGFVFEPDADIEAEMVLYGRVAGIAGTDNLRRDLSVALLWGTPIALAFGILGAVITSLLSMLIAAIGVWYGGWVDGLIQRITEINIILPSLLIAIMVYVMYSKSIWVILGVLILLNIFGQSLKSYRAAFLQMKEAGYIEAARAYGASNGRIITRYMIPRIVPVLVPQLVILVPGFVFLEATLAYLGVSDPELPTWGKLIYEAFTNGAFQGHYHWILQPVLLLLLTGLAFALLGYALDRVVNPRLQSK